MNRLLNRKSRLIVETENAVYDRRKARPVIVELKPDYMILRPKGSRRSSMISYTSCLNLAIRNEIARQRLEKAKAKKKRI